MRTLEQAYESRRVKEQTRTEVAEFLRALARGIEGDSKVATVSAYAYSQPTLDGSDAMYLGRSIVVHEGIDGFPNDMALMAKLRDGDGNTHTYEITRPQKAAETCEGCRFYKRLGISEHGVCHRRAPTGEGLIVVDADDWCGEFEPKPCPDVPTP